MTTQTGKLDSDVRDWLTVAEMEAKMGKDAAKAMIAFKEANHPEHCRDHPDAPGVKDILTMTSSIMSLIPPAFFRRVFGETNSNYQWVY